MTDSNKSMEDTDKTAFLREIIRNEVKDANQSALKDLKDEIRSSEDRIKKDFKAMGYNWYKVASDAIWWGSVTAMVYIVFRKATTEIIIK